MARSDEHSRLERGRSRSPYRESSQSKQQHHHRDRDRDNTERHSRRHHHHANRKPRTSTTITLPLRAQPLSKHDLDAWKPLFALYLDVQKQIYIEDLDDREIKGRWKSFVGKWNRGELAEGWYDPTTREKANANVNANEDRAVTPSRRSGRDQSEQRNSPSRKQLQRHHDERESSSDDDDDVGPTAPRGLTTHARAGPTIPNRDDLDMREELRNEDRANALTHLRHARKFDRTIQQSRLNDLIPKPDAGTHAARMEKKRDIAYAQAAYKDAQDANGMTEMGDNEIMGDDGVDAFKRQKKEMERKKNEREVRKEEVLRARMAEREVVLQARREKEDKTMEMLKAIARERFG